MPYSSVLSLLHSTYGWPADCAPDESAVEEALAAGQTPEQVAAALESALVAGAAQIGTFYGQTEDTKTILRRRLYGQAAHFNGTDTRVALGLIHELPVDTIGAAQSPSQWWEWQDRLRNRLGEKLCDADEFARRMRYAAVVPMEWRGPGVDPLIYQLAVREGYLPVGMERFDPAYLQSVPKLSEVRGLDATQWLQNLQAHDKGRPWPWRPTAKANQ